MPDGNNSQRSVPCNIATSDINGQTLPLGAMAFDSFFFSSTIQRRTVGYYVCGCYTLRLRILLERSSLGIISVLLTIMFDAVNNSNCRLQARSRTKESSRFALATLAIPWFASFIGRSLGKVELSERTQASTAYCNGQLHPRRSESNE
jgi:hypothetical protein